MNAIIPMPQNVDISSSLGALIAHYNSSPKSVQRMFARLFKEYAVCDAVKSLQAKIERGEYDIRNGKGISQQEGESNEEFFDRLCTM